jgi:hypothetical protein
MATFDQLSAEQRAIIELVLKQGQSYGQLGEMLGMPEKRVQELARDSLVKLSPVSAAGVDDDWRGQIADYLLQQQSGSDSSATRGHLRRSESARAWSRSILDSLDQFYDPANLPSIPAGDGGAPAKPRPPREPKARGKEPPEARAAEGEAAEERPPKPVRRVSAQELRRRQLAGGAALAVIALLALLVWPVGLLTGDDSGDGKKTTEKAQPKAKVIGQLLLQPVRKSEGTGVAVIASRGKQRQLIVQARLPVTANGEAYEVWLYNSPSSARSLGAQVTDRQGMFQGAGPLPEDFARYRFIDVSREKVDRNARHSGNSVLRGRIEDFTAPTQSSGQTTTPKSGSGR